MSTPITEATVDRACNLSSLLIVVAHASRMVDQLGEEHQHNMTCSIATTLDLAAELMEELVVVLDANKQKEGGANV